eukprot:gene23661-32033_t
MSAVRNEKGEWVIPASRRPDGTWRQEKVIKEGYVPQEEIKAFETRSKKPLVKSIPGMPPPAPSSVHSKEKGSSKKISSPRPTSSSSSSSIPNPTKKPSNDLKSAKLPTEESAPDISELHIKESRNYDNNESSSVCNDIKLADASEQSGIEKEKKLKSLRKKLRDIEELAKKDPKTLIWSSSSGQWSQGYQKFGFLSFGSKKQHDDEVINNVGLFCTIINLRVHAVPRPSTSTSIANGFSPRSQTLLMACRRNNKTEKRKRNRDYARKFQTKGLDSRKTIVIEQKRGIVAKSEEKFQSQVFKMTTDEDMPAYSGFDFTS